MNTYSETMQSRKALLVATASDIVAYLPLWSIRDNDDRSGITLAHTDGALVSLSTVTYGSNAGKLHATMLAPNFWTSDDRDAVDAMYKEVEVYNNVDYRHNSDTPNRFRIGVNLSPSRPADVLAKDLNKRLLVHAVAYHAEAMAAVDAHRAQLDYQAATIARIVEAVPGTRSRANEGVTFGNYDYAQVSTDGMVRFESLTVSADQAIAIMRLLETTSVTA